MNVLPVPNCVPPLDVGYQIIVADEDAPRVTDPAPQRAAELTTGSGVVVPTVATAGMRLLGHVPSVASA